MLRSSLRIVQAGTEVAEVKGKDLIPAHGLAMSRLLETSLFPTEDGLLPVPGLLLTCSFRPYPLILWITVLPFLCESVPLAAVERPSVASQ